MREGRKRSAAPWGERTVTPEERANEHVKFFANWLNTIGTGIMTAGCFVPIFQKIFDFLPAGTDVNLVYASGIVCFVLGAAIHLVAHLFLGGFLR